ncbi:MAG: SH3 domain-containing protein, partial [Parachlamydiaceae bacterium]|nr:SH3 domain-containing protein [Parachlamydiaceae bacterium]
MRIIQFSSLILPCFCCIISPVLSDETTSSNQVTMTSEAKAQKKSFTPFTGQITKPKVRLRLQPTYDGQILRELNPGEMVVVLGETEDFLAIAPPSDFKAYIYRTFVLDNVVEGSRVNVRLKPDLEAPVLAQLASGTPVNGSIDPNNNKWIQMSMPET